MASNSYHFEEPAVLQSDSSHRSVGRDRVYTRTHRRNSEGTQSEESESRNSQDSPGENSHPKLRLVLRTAIGLLLFSLVLTCVTFSKLTLISLADELRRSTVGKNLTTASRKAKDDNHHSVVRLYWQLLFIMVLPHCLSFMRSALVGVIGKTTKSHPWPCRKAIIVGAVSSVVEVLAVSFFVFSVLCYLTPDLALLSMQAVFFVQFFIDIYYMQSLCKCNGQHNMSRYRAHKVPEYFPIDEETATSSVGIHAVSRFERWRTNVRKFFCLILENKQMRFFAALLQILGIVGMIVFIVIEVKTRKEVYLFPVIVLPLSITTLSIVWSNKVQEYLATPGNDTCYPPCNARYKANFINSALRILLYPFLAYAVFFAIHSGEFNPWSVIEKDFQWSGDNLLVFLAQVLASFLGYVFAWIACIMTLSTVGFALPLLLSTLVAIIIAPYSQLFPGFSHTHYIKDDRVSYLAPLIWCGIYIGQLLGIVYFLCTKNNLILSQDKDMFINPHYDGVFLEQYLTLNRQVDKYSMVSVSTVHGRPNSRRAIFICSTMFRETVREMRQMLKSIKRMAKWHTNQCRRKGDGKTDKIESHIFFDGAVNGGQLTQYALQLLSLVDDCLGVKRTSCIRKETPYGQSMTWYIESGYTTESDMRFTVHLKDNFKVKNKKRWSQVMYMNYVINHRIQKSQRKLDKSNHLDEENTFILTTDADIDFSAESATVLLDSLASNKEVGAVCARTHPIGSGAIYWYQVFDYAIGHWFLKPAEHLMGCVLCCPGCFSVFRCSALAEVLKEYSSEVEGAADFLTKDMGEDRWLCTLLIQKGWRLDYCSISEDHTYCPESFDEFYKQRRRWVPSTIANLMLLISKASSITKANNSVSMLFIIFQFIMAFSTAISPATVILIIASGLQGAYGISNNAVLATIIILIFVSVFYGLVCLYTSQKTQLDLAKLLTFFFVIVMAVVVVGLFKEIIFEIFPVDEAMKQMQPPLCRNTTNPYSDCMIAQNNLGVGLNMSAHYSSIRLPTSPTTWYLALFAVTFTVAAILHYREWTCLVQCVWYFLALPSGYLLLLIYSAANLDSQSWGTREAASKASGGFVMTKKWVQGSMTTVRDFMAFCCCKKLDEPKVPLLLAEPESDKSDEEETTASTEPVAVIHKKMTQDAIEWLKKQDCLDDKEKFEAHGYWNLSYIVSMTRKEFKAIGIQRQGFILRLEKAAKKLPAMVIETEVPQNITKWLKALQMDEYTEVFHSAGYKTEEDVENLKELNEKELNRMGVRKMAHVHRLKQALNSLFHPTEVEVQIYEAKRDINGIPFGAMDAQDEEFQFWTRILSKELKPVTVRLQQTSKEIGQKLKSLRNSTLAGIFLINVMWIILLYTVTFPQLDKYGLPEKAFQLLFLGVYGIIILVSFVAMLAHRFIMLMHFLGRPEVVEQAIAPAPEEFHDLSLAPSTASDRSRQQNMYTSL